MSREMIFPMFFWDSPVQGKIMKILLVLNNTQVQNLRVMVKLTNKTVIKQVIQMMEDRKNKELFDLVMQEGEVVDYLPFGKSLGEKPVVTLIEDIL